MLAHLQTGTMMVIIWMMVKNKGQLDSAINNVASDVTQLSNNAVKYDSTSKDQITLGGTNGTTITNVKNGAVVKDSKDAVNGIIVSFNNK